MRSKVEPEPESASASAGNTSTAPANRNRAIVRRLMDEVLGQGRLELLPELVADEYVGHFAFGDHYGPGGVRVEVVAYRTALPDLVVTVDDLLTDGGHVVRRFTLRGTHQQAFLDVPASGQAVLLRGIGIDRLAEGQLVESWVQIDRFPQ